MAPLLAEIEIQDESPNPAETKEMCKGPRARVNKNHSGADRVPHPAAVPVERAIAVWIWCPVQTRCQMQTKITSKRPAIQQMIRSMRSGLMNTAASTSLMWPLEVSTPRGAETIAPVKAIPGMTA